MCCINIHLIIHPITSNQCCINYANYFTKLLQTFKTMYIVFFGRTYVYVFVDISSIHRTYSKFNKADKFFSMIHAIYGKLICDFSGCQIQLHTLNNTYGYTSIDIYSFHIAILRYQVVTNKHIRCNLHTSNNGATNGKVLSHQDRQLHGVKYSQGPAIISLSKKLYTHCSVLVGSRNGFGSVSIN